MELKVVILLEPDIMCLNYEDMYTETMVII